MRLTICICKQYNMQKRQATVTHLSMPPVSYRWSTVRVCQPTENMKEMMSSESAARYSLVFSLFSWIYATWRINESARLVLVGRHMLRSVTSLIYEPPSWLRPRPCPPRSSPSVARSLLMSWWAAAADQSAPAALLTPAQIDCINVALNTHLSHSRYYFALGRGVKYCDKYVCLSVCSHISKTTRPIFTKFLCMCPVHII